MDRIDFAAAGADPTGSDPVDDAFERVLADGVELRFGGGTYLVEGPLDVPHDDVALRGEGATLVPTDRTEHERLLRLTGDGVVVEGFEYDVTDCAYPPGVTVRAPNWALRRFVVRGEMNTRPHHEETGVKGRTAFRLATTDPDGAGLFEDVYLHEGCAPPGVADDRRAVLAVDDCVGALTLRRCWFERWAENTVYAQNVPGPLTVEDCFFRNTNVGSPRVGGDTTVRNCTVVKDGPVPLQGWWNREHGGGAGVRGCWVAGGDAEHGATGTVVVEGCDFHFTHPMGTRPPIALAPPSEETVVRDTRVRIDHASRPAIRLGADGETALTLDGVHVTQRTNGDTPAISLDGHVTEWGPLSGAVETDGRVSNVARVADAMATAGADRPDTTPPLPAPPAPGHVPSGRAGE